jgi:hypothetical protein
MTCEGEFLDEVSGFSVYFEDDGRVAYAYLLDPGGDIVGDIWLYNRCNTPIEPEWRSPDNMPFANPADYAKDHRGFIPVSDISEVDVRWINQAGEFIKAGIFIRDNLFAILTKRAKPGWSIMAAKDGPLAKVLEVQ